MATNMNRVVISVPADIETEIERLKQVKYYDKPYVEVYRQLIRLGLEKLDEGAAPERAAQKTAEAVLKML